MIVGPNTLTNSAPTAKPPAPHARHLRTQSKQQHRGPEEDRHRREGVQDPGEGLAEPQVAVRRFHRDPGRDRAAGADEHNGDRRGEHGCPEPSLPRHRVGEGELEPALLLVLPSPVRRGDGEQRDSECGEDFHRPDEPRDRAEVAEPELPHVLLHLGVLRDVLRERARDPADDETSRGERDAPADEPSGALTPLERERRAEQAGLHLRRVALTDDAVAEVALTRQPDRGRAEGDSERGQQQEWEHAVAGERSQLLKPAERRQPPQPPEPTRSVGDHSQQKERAEREAARARCPAARREQLRREAAGGDEDEHQQHHTGAEQHRSGDFLRGSEERQCDEEADDRCCGGDDEHREVRDGRVGDRRCVDEVGPAGLFLSAKQARR